MSVTALSLGLSLGVMSNSSDRYVAELTRAAAHFRKKAGLPAHASDLLPSSTSPAVRASPIVTPMRRGINTPQRTALTSSAASPTSVSRRSTISPTRRDRALSPIRIGTTPETQGSLFMATSASVNDTNERPHTLSITLEDLLYDQERKVYCRDCLCFEKCARLLTTT